MTSFHNDKSAARPLAYASAVIRGDRIGPEYWNAYFGICPNAHFVEKGKHWITRSGKQSSSPGQSNVWGYSTKGVMTNDFLAPHLLHLISVLGLPRPDLKSLIEDKRLAFQVSCFWWNPAKTRVTVIEPNLEDIINKSGGTLFIDEYPCDISIDE
jgi:hypothetical protein